MKRGLQLYFRGKKTGKTGCFLRRKAWPPGLVFARFCSPPLFAARALLSRLSCQVIRPLSDVIPRVIGRALHGHSTVIGRASHRLSSSIRRCLITWPTPHPSRYRTLERLLWLRLITWPPLGLALDPDNDPKSVTLAGFHARTVERPRRSTRPCPCSPGGAESARARGRPIGALACGKPVDRLGKPIGLSVSPGAVCGFLHIFSLGFPQDFHSLSTAWPFL